MNILAKIEELAQKLGKQQRKGFYEASRIILLCIQNPTLDMDSIGKLYMDKYEDSKLVDGDVVHMNLFQFKLTKSSYRIKDLKVGKEVAHNICKVIQGKPVKNADYNIKEPVKKIVLLELTEMLGDSISKETIDSIMKLNMSLSVDFYNKIIDMLQEKNTGTDDEFYKNEVTRLQGILSKLQTDFDTKLEESKFDEQYKLMEMLNSNKYGNILNLLTIAKKDMQTTEDIPIKMRTAVTLVRRLSDFVKACNITEIMEIGKEFEVTASEIHQYIYSGTPFQHKNDIKKVRVTSSGFEIKDRDIIISDPAVQEVI